MLSYLLSFCLIVSFFECQGDVSLADDPSLFPGHLQPLGSHRPQSGVEIVNDFPEPHDFFKNYVDKSVPLLIQGAAKKSPAFKLWEDDYLKSHKEAETFEVFVENRKKEIRTAGGYYISLKKFIETYHKDDIYMVNGVPDHLQKDVRLPSPLRCEETKKLLVDTVTWFSSGGTKSVLHNDDVDNINCLIRGKKQLMFISYEKYKTKVDIDRPEGGYSDLDVDKVDFVKYPGMREIEYINATMNEGDCLFIPYKWFHQVNSWSNDNGMNVAVNVWFQHKLKHRPKRCKMSPDEATLDKFIFSDLERQKKEAAGGGQDGEGQDVSFNHLEGLITKSNKKELNFEEFVEMVKKDIAITKIDISDKPTLKSFSDVVKKVFDIVDVNKNSKMDIPDFDEIEKNTSEEIDSNLRSAVATVEDYCEDLNEAIMKGVSLADFEASLKKGEENGAEDDSAAKSAKDEL